MKAARAVRQLSQLGCWSARQDVSRGLGCAWNEQRRGFWAIRLMRGVHEVVGHAISLGEYATGVRPLQAAARSSPTAQNTTGEDAMMRSSLGLSMLIDPSQMTISQTLQKRPLSLIRGIPLLL
jgi:hypothetical protein